MADKDISLDELLQQQEKLARDANDIDQKIRKTRQLNATKYYEEVVALIRANGEFFSTNQRNTIKKLIDVDASAGKRDRKAPSELTPIYQLDTGEKWHGKRGKRPAAFNAWSQSAEGKKWLAANVGEKFPKYPNPNFKGDDATPTSKAASKAKPATKSAKKK